MSASVAAGGAWEVEAAIQNNAGRERSNTQFRNILKNRMQVVRHDIKAYGLLQLLNLAIIVGMSIYVVHYKESDINFDGSKMVTPDNDLIVTADPWEKLDSITDVISMEDASDLIDMKFFVEYPTGLAQVSSKIMRVERSDTGVANLHSCGGYLSVADANATWVEPGDCASGCPAYISAESNDGRRLLSSRHADTPRGRVLWGRFKKWFSFGSKKKAPAPSPPPSPPPSPSLKCFKKCSRPCPPNWGVKETCPSWWQWWKSATVQCVPPAVSNASPLYSSYSIAGECGCSGLSSCQGRPGPSVGACSSGDTSVSTAWHDCCSNAFGACDRKYGQREVRVCNQGSPFYVFELYSSFSCSSYVGVGGKLSQGFEACRWYDSQQCSRINDCWLPYYVKNGASSCTPTDPQGVGYFSASGAQISKGATGVDLV